MGKDKEAWDACDANKVAESIKLSHLSPRALEACEIAGVEPVDLIPITKAEFRERQGVDLPPKHIIKMRWEHHEKLRIQKVQEMLDARKKLIDEGGLDDESVHGSKSVRDHNVSRMSRSTKTNHNQSQAPGAGGSSTMIEREKNEIEKMKQRQKKELE